MRQPNVFSESLKFKILKQQEHFQGKIGLIRTNEDKSRVDLRQADEDFQRAVTKGKRKFTKSAIHHKLSFFM